MHSLLFGAWVMCSFTKKTQMYDPETGCVYEHCEKSPVGADPFYDLAVHLSTIFSEGIEEDCDHE